VTFSGTSALVCGGAGFIGSHLTEALVERGADPVVVLDDLSLGRRENLATVEDRITFRGCDCADIERLREIVPEGPFDLCFNLAVIPLPASLERPRETAAANVAMTTSICELGREGVYSRLVQFSSSEVYGTAQAVPMSEQHPLSPHTPYGAAKAATDLLALSYHATFGLEVDLIRPFNAYGPRQNDGAYAALIPAVLRCVRDGRPVTVHGDGEQTRDLTFVTDVVEGTLAIARSDAALGRAVNLGRGDEISVGRTVRALLAAAEMPQYPVEHGPPRQGDVRRLLADVSLAERLVGYRPKVDLDEGLRLTVDWYFGQA
jgi:UDP-glucose 4-epimerase